jgi:hypothetical protein
MLVLYQTMMEGILRKGFYKIPFLEVEIFNLNDSNYLLIAFSLLFKSFLPHICTGFAISDGF